MGKVQRTNLQDDDCVDWYSIYIIQHLILNLGEINASFYNRGYHVCHFQRGNSKMLDIETPLQEQDDFFFSIHHHPVNRPVKT
mmetsp:Transcript_58123/g.62797  ORF Transcript_58123/g.62797 Transcript_58123/m.62797 type:complete len:83 (-) Transcript_58123:165-413(-)